MPSEVLCFADCLGVFLCQWEQGLVARQFIQIPHTAGEESAAPVGRAAIIHTAFAVQCYRVQTFATCFDGVYFQSDLCLCVFNHLFRPRFLLLRRTTRCDGKECRTSQKDRVTQFHIRVFLL